MRILLICMTLLSCSATKFIYNMDFPSENVTLSGKLNEISGMVMLNDSVIAAIQDEKANIYFLEASTGKIIDQIDFGKNADYEGITHHNELFYVLRSDGTIFEVSKKKKSKEYNFKKSKDFDFEGICAQPEESRLLVACKDHGDKDKRDHFYIYAFSLATKKYEKKPAFKIKRELVHKNFKPSGIAIHPTSRNVFILSSFSKTLLVLSPQGEIIKAVQLNDYIFHQPEGITFDSKGDLYISNEKKDTSPSLLKFTYSDAKN